MSGKQGRTVRVLNAFRHHRDDHGQEKRHENERILCSTPFGITEMITAAYLQHTGGIRSVLNAFRHHSDDHAEHLHLHAVTDLCSPPFGITEMITGEIGKAPQTGPQMCSTPFGITEMI